MRQEDDFYATDPKAIEALFNAPCYSRTQVTELYLKRAKKNPIFIFGNRLRVMAICQIGYAIMDIMLLRQILSIEDVRMVVLLMD